jgi:MFS transporter, ACS family, allantoate permease
VSGGNDEQGRIYLHPLQYVGYLVAEFPTQYLSQRISRLGKYLGANIVLWGAVLAAHAAAQNYAGLMICRALLGVFEACVSPTLVLVVAMWYKKSEQGRRISYVYVCNRSVLSR